MLPRSRSRWGNSTSHITRPGLILMGVSWQGSWEIIGWLREEKTSSVHKTIFHFCTVCPNGALGGCARGNPMFLLHTLWQTLISQFQLGEDDRAVTQSSQHHRLFERSIQVDSQRHRPMRKTSTSVDKMFPYYLRETTKDWSGSSLQVLENHWAKTGQWVFHSPYLPNVENANLKKIFLQMIFKNSLTRYFIISSLVELWRIFKLVRYHIISINRCWYYYFSYHYHPCELMLHEYDWAQEMLQPRRNV